MKRIAATVVTGDAARISRSDRRIALLRGVIGTCLLLAVAPTVVHAQDCNSNGIPDADEIETQPGLLDFDGIDDVVSIPLDVSETSYTVSIWFRTMRLTTGIYCVTEGLAPAKAYDRVLYFSNGSLFVRTWNNELIIASGITYSDGQWHNLVHVFGGSVGGQRLYFDGVLRTIGTRSSSDFSKQTHVVIGYGPDISPAYFDGQIDEVRIWNTALSSAEIGQIYTGPNPPVVANLQGYWKFNETSGQATADSSGMGNGGILGGMAGKDAADPTRIFGPTISTFFSDCTSDGMPDICQPGGAADCDADGISDSCAIAGGEADCNSNSIPDSCEYEGPPSALTFDGGNDRVFVPRSVSLEPGYLTIEMWARLNGPQARNTRLLRKSPHLGGAAGYIWALDQDFDSRLQLQVFTPSAVIVEDTVSHSAYSGQWHHFAGVYAADYARLYVDGNLVSSISHSNGPVVHNTLTDLYIGSGLPSPDTAEFYFGDLDEVRIWDIARTQEEIQNDMSAHLYGNEPGLVGYWRFNEEAGQVIGDSSPMGNHGFRGTDSLPAGDAGDPAWIAEGSPISGRDCNNNGIIDECDIADMTSSDCNSNGTPDECELAGIGNRVFIPGLQARAWPSEHGANPPARCVDGSLSTFTWSTASLNVTQPSYLGVFPPSLGAIDGIRLWKDNDGGGGANTKDLVIQYTTDLGPSVGSGNWKNVSNLSNGLAGTELMMASSVLPSGIVTGDVHDSVNEGHGYATLTFDRVMATGIRIGFSFDGTTANHYKVHEAQLFTLSTVDCNSNGIIDECETAAAPEIDCNSNGTPDECEFGGVDCNSNGLADLCEPGGNVDCDFNGNPDFCDIAGGAGDCNSNGLIDDCEFVTLTQALEFDGVDDWVRVPRSPTFEPTDELTVEAWVRPDTAGSFHSRIVRTSGHFASGYILAWQQQGDGRVQMRIDAAELGGAAAKDTVPTSTYFGQWHHIAGVYSLSGNFCRLYVDGVQKAEVPAVGHLQYSGSDLVIGNFFAQTNEDFDGGIDEVRIWNVARTEQELNDHMSTMLVGNEPGLVSYWRFDEGQGQIAHDLSGSGNHGTLGNNADPGGDALDPAWTSPGPPINTADCNTNGILDECDIADGTSDDCNFNGMPDECEPNEDCNSNGMPDICDLGSGASMDCNSNGTPDECEQGGDQDCNTNGVSDLCDLFAGASEDCDGNLVPDECDSDFDNDSIIDGCDNCPYNRNIKQTDSDEDGIGNICDNCPLTANTDQSDEDNDGIGDVCDTCPSVANAANQTDSDSDGVGDVCDQCPGFDDLADQDGDCIADGCDLCPTRATGDVNGDGVVNAADIGPFTDVLLNGTISFLKLCASDVNGDLKVTDADIGPFCELIMIGGCQ